MNLNLWSIPPLLMAGVTAFVALHYAIIFLRTRGSREPLTFAAMTAAMCAYDTACVFLYSAADTVAGRPWQLTKGLALFTWAICLVLFVADYTRRPYGRFVKGVCLVGGLLMVGGLLGDTRLLYTDTPTVQHFDLPLGLSVTYNEVQEGPLAITLYILSFGVFIYVFLSGIAYFRDGERQRASRLLLATGVLFLGATNDLALSAGEIRSVYVLEYVFMGMVLLMSDSLSSELVRAGKIEEALLQSERNYRELFNASTDAIFVHDAETGAILDVNQTTLDLYGYGRDDLMRLRVHELSARQASFSAGTAASHLRRAREEGPQIFDWMGRRKDGTEFWVEVALRSSSIGGKDRVLAVVRDIGDRKRAEKEVRLSEERFKRLAEASFEGIGITESSRIVDANTRLAEMLGYEVREMLGRHVMDFVAPDSAELVAEVLRTESGDRIEHLAIRKDGTVFPIETQGRALPSAGANVRVAAVRDITEGKKAAERIRRQLDRLAALRLVDASITRGDSLEVTTQVVLEQVQQRLHVDAADVLRLDDAGQALTFSAGRGFRRGREGESEIAIESSLAGWAIEAGGSVHLADMAEAPSGRTVPPAVAAEGYLSFHAVPLVSKGKVHGVLEVFDRTGTSQSEEWVDFFEAVAGQLAIAIDGRDLFEDLQRTNASLAVAYDTTLAGWSRALELRDQETRGHSERVVHLTVRLAEAMGVPDDALVHVRRGAQLHDIGKMGIPDSILLKPGPLTEEEWVVMRQHPEFAYQLLWPIEFLRPALDIPYCHHERWDGSGYPRGLAGEEIPLAARIFSVADAWDALCNARPYRGVWPEERVRAHLKEETGRRFDPAVIETFLRIVP